MHIILLFLLFSTVVSQENTKWCRATTRIYPKALWTKATGGDCFTFAKPSWKKQNLKLYSCTQKNYPNHKFTCGVYKNSTDFYFDYTNATSTNIIENELMKNGFYAKWLNCAIAADECCTKQMTNDNIYPTTKYLCPYIWDIWSCFPAAEKDTISKQPCPDYTSSSNTTPCILYSEKECFSHGEWNQTTNYAVCATAPVYRRRHSFNVIVCYVAIALCFPAVIIFISFKKLKNTRISLHRNLLIACILRNILTAVSKELVILDSLKSSKDSNQVLEGNGIPCRVLAFFASASVNAVYACMLMDGYYLHKRIARVFANKSEPGLILIYSVTLGITFIPSIIWAIVVALNDNTNCWMVDSFGHEWILDGCRIAILAINIILLLDIGRVLLMKLKKDMSEEHTKYTYILINGKSYNSILRRAFKTTLKVMIFLAVLFGVPFIFTANRDIVDRDSCLAGDIFYYFSYLIHSLQGVMVAFLFCYFNKEVRNQIKEAFNKTQINTRSRLSTANFRRVTNRQNTSGTYLSNNYSKTTKAKKLSINQNKKNQEAAKKLSDLIEASATNPNHETQSDAKNEDNLSNRISKYIDDSVSDSQTYDDNNKVK